MTDPLEAKDQGHNKNYLLNIGKLSFFFDLFF